MEFILDGQLEKLNIFLLIKKLTGLIILRFERDKPA